MRFECPGAASASNGKCHSQGCLSFGWSLPSLSLSYGQPDEPVPQTGIHCGEWGSTLAFEIYLDESSTVFLCREDGGPNAGLINEYHPPEPANVCELRGDVHALSECDESEDLGVSVGILRVKLRIPLNWG